MQDTTNKPGDARGVTACLKTMTGQARGTVVWISGDESALDAVLTPGRWIRCCEPGHAPPDQVMLARLHRAGDTFEVEALESQPLWVNGKRVQSQILRHRDLIEFGDIGPLCRFELYGDTSRSRKSVTDIFADSVDYLRVSRKPKIERVGRAARDVVRSFTLETTILFRVSVVIAIIALTAITVHLSQMNLRLQQQVADDAKRLESVSAALARARQEALSPGDLNVLRQEFGHRLTAAAERLALLEERFGASARVIESALRSIVLMQGAYGFRDRETQRMLRLIVDDAGGVVLSPRGQPMVTLDGNGPVAERQFIGTSFIVAGSGTLVTNRHVALPWEDDATYEVLRERGMEPVMIKFIGYLPEIDAPFSVKLLKASDDADLAVLSLSGVKNALPHLKLAEKKPRPGDEVILMGYPTGLKSLLAQTGNAFIEQLQKGDVIDFWMVAQRLSEEKYIRPLASRGIVGQVTQAAVVYDAETTLGGSGGPVLDIDGNVVAVNAAIIPEYGGSNLGVPAEKVLRLLKAAGF